MSPESEKQIAILSARIARLENLMEPPEPEIPTRADPAPTLENFKQQQDRIRQLTARNAVLELEKYNRSLSDIGGDRFDRCYLAELEKIASLRKQELDELETTYENLKSEILPFKMDARQLADLFVMSTERPFMSGEEFNRIYRAAEEAARRIIEATKEITP